MFTVHEQDIHDYLAPLDANYHLETISTEEGERVMSLFADSRDGLRRFDKFLYLGAATGAFTLMEDGEPVDPSDVKAAFEDNLTAMTPSGRVLYWPEVQVIMEGA